MSELVLHVDHNCTYIIEGRLSGEAYQAFKKSLGYLPENWEWMQREMEERYGESAKKWYDPWVTAVCYNRSKCRCHIKKDYTHFPSGLLPYARKFFATYGIPYRMVDVRLHAKKRELDLSLAPGIQPYDYQSKVVQDACNKQRGIIKAATGSGKTFMGSNIIAELGVSPFVFYVTSVDLLEQARAELQRFIYLNGSNLEVGAVGGGYKEIRDITVMTVQTAVRALDAKYEKFDEEDKAKDGTDIEDIKKDIKDYIYSCKGMICDECITGDAVVLTEDGPVQMDKLDKFVGKKVQSFDGNSVVWRKITHFYRKGVKRVVRVVLSNNLTIRCTADHLLATDRGWVAAGQLSRNDKIRCFVNAAAERRSRWSEEAQADFLNTSSGIRSSDDLTASGKLSSNVSRLLLQHASADAENKYGFIMARSSRLSPMAAAANTIDLFTGTTNDRLIGQWFLQNLNSKRSSELCSEIRLSHSRRSAAKLRVCTVITGYLSLLGFNTKLHFCESYHRLFGNMKTAAMAILLARSVHRATPYCEAFTTLRILTALNNLADDGWMLSASLGWRGGYVTTAADRPIRCDFTLKDLRQKKLNWQQNGSENDTATCQSISRENIVRSLFSKHPERPSRPLLLSSCPSACNTNFVGVHEVVECGEEEVFDITVEGTHCFFANGMLAHNCQHWAASTCQVVSDAAKSAHYRYGLSATPYRDQGDDILIEACFGGLIANISASFLIERGFLVQPEIYFITVDNVKIPKYSTYANVYKEGVVENTLRNTWISNLSTKFFESGRYPLVLVKQIEHGKMLEKLIPNSTFLHGSSGNKKRKKHIEAMRNGRYGITIATSIFDEGVDVKPLDTLILAGSGKSPTRALQRIGRVIRTYKGPLGEKKNAIVVDFDDQCKYLADHSKRRRMIYQTEPNFIIKNLKL